MMRFFLRENIAKFETVLQAELSDGEQRYFSAKLREMRRQLAVLEAQMLGAQNYPWEFGRVSGRDEALLQQIIEQCEKPSMILDPREGIHIMDVNDEHAAITFKQRFSVAGERLFDAFPDNPDHKDADGVVSLLDSLRIASHTRRTHIREFRYDLRDPSGQFVQRVWRTESIPIFNGDGALFCILHQAEDVTAREQRQDLDGAAA